MVNRSSLVWQKLIDLRFSDCQFSHEPFQDGGRYHINLNILFDNGLRLERVKRRYCPILYSYLWKKIYRDCFFQMLMAMKTWKGVPCCGN